VVIETVVPVNYDSKSLVSKSNIELNSDIDYAISVADNYLKDILEAGFDINGKEVLEIGPGINFGTALILLWNGAKKVTVIDKYLSEFAVGYHDKLYRDLRIKYFETNSLKFGSDINKLESYEFLLTEGRLSTIESGLENIGGLAFDITLSCAVLEHLENPHNSVKNLFSLTKSNGFGSHQIDFRDHRNFDKPLEYLLLDEMSFFELFQSVHGECGNRTRSFQWASIFREFFGNQVDISPNMWAQEPYFGDFISRLSKAEISNFSKYDSNDLKVLSGKIKYTK
jgi:SAM-dependent methyltransferase